LDLFQRHEYFLSSSISSSRDIMNIHNTLSELTQQTTYYVLPAARDCMVPVYGACPSSATF
jgi:hypothetical protein